MVAAEEDEPPACGTTPWLSTAFREGWTWEISGTLREAVSAGSQPHL